MSIFRPVYLWFWTHEGYQWMRRTKKMTLTVFEKPDKKRRPGKPWVLRYANHKDGLPLEKGEGNYPTMKDAVKAGNRLIRNK